MFEYFDTRVIRGYVYLLFFKRKNPMLTVAKTHMYCLDNDNIPVEISNLVIKE